MGPIFRLIFCSGMGLRFHGWIHDGTTINYLFMHINMDHFLEWSWKHENHLFFKFFYWGQNAYAEIAWIYERALPGWGGFVGFQTWMRARFAWVVKAVGKRSDECQICMILSKGFKTWICQIWLGNNSWSTIECMGLVWSFDLGWVAIPPFHALEQWLLTEICRLSILILYNKYLGLDSCPGPRLVL